MKTNDEGYVLLELETSDGDVFETLKISEKVFAKLEEKAKQENVLLNDVLVDAVLGLLDTSPDPDKN